MKSIKFLLATAVCAGFLTVGCKHTSASDSTQAGQQAMDCKCGKGCSSCKTEGEEKKCGCH